jgi:FecR protein
MPIVRPIGRERGSLAPLLIVTLFWFNGCQSLSAQSESTSASDTGWKITAQAGSVSVRSPDRSFWQRAWPGARIPPGSQIATFKGSSLEVASAGDQVMASGPSRFTLPNAEHNGVRVHQDAGILRYKVQSAAKRHFEVKTPHFSTVVKGTSFLVSIDRTSSEVFVDEGRVLILDPDGEPLAELTAGQTGRMAAHPGAPLEIGTVSNLSFETGMGLGSGVEPSAHGNTTTPQTTGARGASKTAAIREAEVAATEPSLFERIGGLLADLAAQISTGDVLTTGGVRLGSDRGGGGREQESWNNGSSTADRSYDYENGKGTGKDKGSKSKDKDKGNGKGKHRDKDKGKGNDKSKGKSKSGKGKGKNKDKGKGNDKGKGRGKGRGKSEGNGKGKGEGRGKGQGHDRGKGPGGSAYINLDHNDRRHLIAWNEPG